MVSQPPKNDPAKAYAEALGDLNAISLDSLDGSDSSSRLRQGAPPLDNAPGQENSFADARLEAPEPEPLRSGESQGADSADSEGKGMGLDLALVDGGAVMVSKADLQRGKAPSEEPKHETLESRGATGVAAPGYEGPVPAGHVARPRGLFFFDPISNSLAAAAIALTVAIVPAWVLASGTANGDDAMALVEKLEALHAEIDILEDPERGGDGPQSLEAVTAALTAKANEVDSASAQLDEVVSSAGSRFWGVWLGLGIPLGIALSVLRKKG